ncbi:hypothetical protein BG011_005382 [Mortierella polycephala]|uniref:PROP1-like PPR domain-containing protein n=1 Tax=Mortierella polycephala TaxID=41804 RepID=A0A9P6PXI4_9FUNG|nr:hypothetical protein BG011_005382 [Mortierella polycephala]
MSSFGIRPKDSGSPSIWACRCSPLERTLSKRYLHSSRSRRSFIAHHGPQGAGMNVTEKRAIVAELRQRSLLKGSTFQLWGTYQKIVRAGALPMLQSDDVTAVFQALSRSYQSEEAMEMMLQVALDVNEIGKQIPQEAFDILLLEAVDHMPAEQVKAILWQIQGRRRFISEFIQLCDSNAEMKTFLGLYRQLQKASFDVDGFSTYFQSRKERAESLGQLVLQWIKGEGKDINPKVQEGLLVFLLDRHVLDQVNATITSLSKEGFKFSRSFYTTAIHRFGRAQKFDYMDMTLELMRKQGLEPLEDTYSAIVDAHSKAGNLREAQRAYQDILAAGLTPANTTFGPMLEAVGKMGDYDMTQQLVGQMNASGVSSNEYTFSALLLSMSHDPDKSVGLFDELSKQVEPNVVNYNLLIRTFQYHGDLDGAFRVFRAMAQSQVQPDQYTFSSILSLFASRGDAEGAEIFWNEMVNVHRVVPNAHAYGSLMHAYCTTEDMLRAQTVYREMIQARIMPNEVIFGTLLNAYARRGDLTQMLSIYDAMRAEGLKPNSYIYSNLLFGLVKDGDMMAAQRLYENMEEDGFGNNVLAQTILMKGYLDKGKFEESQEVYENMLRSGLIPNFMTYATLLHAHAKRGEKKEGRAFLNKILRSRGLVALEDDDDALDANEMALSGLTQSHDHAGPTSSETLVKESLNGPFQEAHLSTHGTERKPLRAAARPKLLMAFTPLLDAYAKESNILATKEMFEEIKALGLEPNTVTYTILMDGYRRVGDVDSVLEIWNQLFNRFQRQRKVILNHPENHRPSKKPVVEWVQDRLSTKASKLQRLLQQPISITIDSLCYSGRVLEAKEIWSQLEQVEFEFDSTNWNDYCIALARNGRMLEACRIFEEKLLPGYLSGRESRRPSTRASRIDLSSRKGDGAEQRRFDFGDIRSSERPLESVSDTKEDLPVKTPATLLYPRPRTFAALADSLDGLLSRKGDTRIRIDDGLSNLAPSTNDQNKMAIRAKRLERQKTLIEAKLSSYPHPFAKLDQSHRQILWNLIRAEYPRVLEALKEGILVARGSRSKRTTTTSTTFAKEKESASTNQGGQVGFSRFRQWHRLRSVMKEMERKRFVEEREERAGLLRNPKPT